jgi:hypothetical protein
MDEICAPVRSPMLGLSSSRAGCAFSDPQLAAHSGVNAASLDGTLRCLIHYGPNVADANLS